MKVLKFKTNVENDGMVAKLAPFLDNEEMIRKWNLDTDSQENILSVSGEEITPEMVTRAVTKAGFQAEIIRILAVGGHDL